ncbi:hypothetical protein [Pelagicoccus sp. SDUM812002]|uniref:hypothetical protein n=1 Tax=Pelagicoccus sp. SDUM812002 TaxID=3041266 RepID=UPI00280EC6A6|nr:hypothetical protein [Pelagicoccus sp. SDUM812002]MDQ8184317.1 hypothetical protein [Pelagicoccus sp. SDUM812002]
MPEAKPDLFVSFAFSVELRTKGIRRPIIEEFAKVQGISLGIDDPSSNLIHHQHRLLLIRPWIKKSPFRRWMLGRTVPASLLVNVLDRQDKVTQTFFFENVKGLNWYLSDFDSSKSDLLSEHFELGYDSLEVR